MDNTTVLVVQCRLPRFALVLELGGIATIVLLYYSIEREIRVKPVGEVVIHRELMRSRLHQLGHTDHPGRRVSN